MKPPTVALKGTEKGLREEDGGDDLTNVQCKSIQYCHNESARATNIYLFEKNLCHQPKKPSQKIQKDRSFLCVCHGYVGAKFLSKTFRFSEIREEIFMSLENENRNNEKAWGDANFKCCMRAILGFYIFPRFQGPLIIALLCKLIDA
jgi:hypothetical protein